MAKKHEQYCSWCNQEAPLTPIQQNVKIHIACDNCATTKGTWDYSGLMDELNKLRERIKELEEDLMYMQNGWRIDGN